ncbi:MAG TPA: flavodoxin family protein [Verrucomicrobiota bacterium]|nr:flavodoxin family protein [Verrucomicrobiota bacterium]HNU50565.1 flavodoxin family protein [Verrucomicrobiota bacterium]
MNTAFTRRQFMAAGAAALAASTTTAAAEKPATPPLKIIGLACSMRPGKTTAVGVQAALAGAKAVSPQIQIEFLDLGGLDLWSAALGRRNHDGSPVKDDFEPILPKLKDPQLAGLIIGSPAYYRTLSAQCKLFLERCAVLREPKLLLADKVVGVLAVGGYRNGGQEMVIEQIQAVMLCHEAIIVGGKPRAHQGATLWNAADDDVTRDTLGMESAAKLGARVADAVLKLAAATR